jgi:hypothetical protein
VSVAALSSRDSGEGRCGVGGWCVDMGDARVMPLRPRSQGSDMALAFTTHPSSERFEITRKLRFNIFLITVELKSR